MIASDPISPKRESSVQRDGGRMTTRKDERGLDRDITDAIEGYE